MDLRDKVAVLTAAGAGIGRSVAKRFGHLGAHVVVSDRDSAAAKTVADDIVADGGKAIGVTCDVSIDEDIASLANAAEQIGPIEVLFNNAGVAVGGPIGKIPLDDWRWVFEVNVLGQVRAINAFLPGMAHRGSGLIINTSSSLALFPEAPLLLPYICSKAGIFGFTEALTLMCAPLGVRVMVLAPHITETNFLFSARLSGIDPEQAMKALPLSELQPPEAVADALFRAIETGQFLATNAPHADSLGTAPSLVDS
ncbi:SDR family oxidoreductase [Mycobacterium intracellulare]|uniref:SDR family NAD(P)-dependent oxidoreductase n=1 Tax=Mycobacterium intracellulare TaxID=1767 RepID=UPI001CDA1DBC|nr:SDR family oxidoreductase [Mycobacterium intracellulare]MCA2356955.1 SDR family oxidoreductase [Mycobacterium intracellulare]